jgi:hypothetical protein
MEENTPINEHTEAARGTTTTLIKHIGVSKPKRSFFEYVKIGFRAYGASLVESLVAVPIVASAVTLGLYFSQPASGWYAVVFGALYTYIAWLFIAVILVYFSTFEGGNARSYGLITTRLRQLEAGLDEMNAQYLDRKSTNLAEYQLEARREANESFADLKRYLYKFPAGLQWVLALGYINAWGKLHRAEEALIEVEPVEVVIRGALHDKLAIQNSTISNRDELLQKLKEAVKELNPAMESRFKTYRPEEANEEIWQLKKAVKKIAAKIGFDLDDDFSDKSIENQTITAEAEARARLTMREVRRVLDDFRDHLWEGLIRARNQLASTIFAAGLVTHILLCIFILSGNPTKDEYLAAAVFYMVGAVAGLFGRIYRESQRSTAFDDYGLSMVRLIANLLLSGLAGIGGVLLFSAFLSGSIMSNPNTTHTLANIFVLNQPEFIIAAAFFGLAPNLIIRSLQQRSEKYISALKSSKGAVEETSDNAN